jgi:hypothetical protein
MEMVKYFAMAAALASSLVLADLAQARGRHGGCASCSAGGYSGGYAAGGCPGGVCSVSMGPAPMKMAVVTAPQPMEVAAVATPMPVVTTAQPVTQPYFATTPRRGLFGWRR